MKKLLLTLVGVICSLGMWADNDITVKWYDRSASTYSAAGTASVADILTVSDATPNTSYVTASSKTTAYNDHYYIAAIASTAAGKQTFALTDFIKFTVTVKSGYSFTPSSVSCYLIGCGSGNSGGALSVGALSKVQASGAESIVLTNSSSESTLTSPSHSITGLTKKYDAGESFDVYVYVGWRSGYASTVGVGDVLISGTYATASVKQASDLTIAAGKSTVALDYPTGTTTYTLTKGTDYTTSSTGTMSYESSNESVATVADGVITAVAPGTAKITMKQAADDTYYAGSVEYTVNVTDVRTASSLSVSPATFSGKVGDTQTIEVTGNAGTVTYSSSNKTAAVVSTDGVITAVAPGTATITVSDPGSATVQPCSKTVEVTVADYSRVATTQNVNEEFVISTANGKILGDNPKTFLSTDGSLYITGGVDGGSNTYNDLINEHLKLSGNITITLPTNYSVSTIDVIGYSNYDSNVSVKLVSADGTEIGTTATDAFGYASAKPATCAASFSLSTPATNNIVLNFSGQSRCYIILNRDAQSVTMNDGGDGNYYSTFYSAEENTVTGANAYTATLDIDNSKLTLKKLTNGVIPARAGVILVNQTGEAATITPSYTGATTPTSDLIGAATKDVSMQSYYGTDIRDKAYVFTLGKDDEKGIGFFKYTGEKLGAGKAYLYNETLALGAKISFFFIDNPTAIQNVELVETKTADGKVMKNGKLVIIKNGKQYNTAGQQIK